MMLEDPMLEKREVLIKLDLVSFALGLTAAWMLASYAISLYRIAGALEALVAMGATP